MNRIKNTVAAVLVVLGLGAAPLLATTATYAAVDPQQQACLGTGGKWTGSECVDNSKQADLTSIIGTIVNVLLYLIGIIAVIVIIVGALRYVTSGGDSSKVSAAKNTILYAVIGLVVAILAFAIVNFVLQSLK